MRRVWVSDRFHKQLKKRALDEDMNMLEFTDKIILKGRDPFKTRGKNENKKKKFTFSI